MEEFEGTDPNAVPYQIVVPNDARYLTDDTVKTIEFNSHSAEHYAYHNMITATIKGTLFKSRST